MPPTGMTQLWFALTGQPAKSVSRLSRCHNNAVSPSARSHRTDFTAQVEARIKFLGQFTRGVLRFLPLPFVGMPITRDGARHFFAATEAAMKAVRKYG
jgi:hypothetical protein